MFDPMEFDDDGNAVTKTSQYHISGAVRVPKNAIKQPTAMRIGRTDEEGAKLANR